MLDFVEETFDQMPLLVEVKVIFPRLFAVLTGRDHRFGCLLGNLIQESFCIIPSVCDHPLKIEVRNQAFRLADVVALACRQQKAKGVAQGIYTGVDLGAEPSPAASEGLAGLPASFFGAPAAQGWARTMVLSSKIFSISGSLAKC